MTNDLTGKRYGMLVAVAPTDQRKAGYTVWRCRCDCGREILVESRRLKRGTISDCGCTSVRARRDLRGQRFGKLLAVKETNRRGKGGSVIWHCQCDCGNTIDAPSNQLLSGYRKSCGCLSRPPLKNWIGKQFGDLTGALLCRKAGRCSPVALPLSMWERAGRQAVQPANRSHPELRLSLLPSGKPAFCGRNLH